MDQDLTPHEYRRILDALPCYVTLLDRQLSVVWSNALCRRDFGSFQGKTCFELYKIDPTRCKDCPVKKTYDDGQPHSTELMLTSNNGSRINALVYSAPLRTDDGEIVSVAELAVNITSVKDIQKQLIMLGQTVAGMAHSLKNIMMGLEGGIYVVNRGIEDDNQQELREGWDMVLLNYEKISQLVKDIIYCSKEREPDFRSIKPNDVVHEIHDLYKEVARQYSIELSLDLDETLEEAVMDPAGLHTVLANLVTNAMDACKMDFWKDTHLVEIRTKKRKDGTTVIEVADNGVGVDKDLKGHVFEDFFTSKGDKGTGLGLMVTQKILREHGGSITFRSRPGQGTTFVATFPKRQLPEDG